MDKQPLRKSFINNWITFLGVLLASVMFTAILALIVLEYMSVSANPYLGIFTYIVLPCFLILGLGMIIAGFFYDRKLRRRKDPERVARFPILDFNQPKYREGLVIVLVVATIFILFSAFGTYKAYHFTESTTFCGLTCHKVMEPEHTAYKHSPHARVDCVQCHIGPGADWFVRSKLSGAYQVYSVIFNKYHRPIETPIRNLRPAQETCEQCHWPEQFFGAIENDHQYFLSDEKNTSWQTRMLVLVGGGERMAGDRKGIHWHMNIANKISYIATDEKRLEIPWVKAVHMDGTETIYVNEESSFSESSPPEGELRRMDCMDCHNRPSHNYRSPRYSVNQALSRGLINAELPFIKREALKVLAGTYEHKEEAFIAIERGLKSFYEKNYAELLKQETFVSRLDKAISSIQEIYRINFFPEMKVSWAAYPEHIGHMEGPGCFRCHDGKHRSAEGKVISHDCNSCHVIIAQGSPELPETSVTGLPFRHPDPEVEGLWQDMSCHECHTGGPM